LSCLDKTGLRNLEIVVFEEVRRGVTGGFRGIDHITGIARRRIEGDIGVGQIHAHAVHNFQVCEPATARRVGADGIINSLEHWRPRAQVGSSAGFDAGKPGEAQGQP